MGIGIVYKSFAKEQESGYSINVIRIDLNRIGGCHYGYYEGYK